MPAVLIEDQLVVPAKVETLAEFRRWTLSDDFPQSGRIDFIRGQIEVDMSPERLYSHGLVKTAIAEAVLLAAREADLGHVYIDRSRMASLPADLSCEPDVCLVSWDSLQTGRVRYRPPPKPSGPLDLLEIEGGPDLVVEIVSPSSVAKDTVRLPPAYFAAGVLELWLVDARAEETRFTIYRRGRKAFRPVPIAGDGFQSSALLKRAFRLLRKPGRVADTVVYQLESRA